MLTHFILIALSLVGSNYFYQAVTDRLWLVATERSVFQVTAILLCALAYVLNERARRA